MPEYSFNVLENLGPLCKYRQPENLQKEWEKVDSLVKTLQEEFLSIEDDRGRLFFALDTARKILLTAQKRADDCQIDHPGLACENIDIFSVMVNWLEFTKGHIDDKP